MTNTVTINGHTYTDDGNASTGLANGGHRTRLLPLVADVVVVAADVVSKAGTATTQAGIATEKAVEAGMSKDIAVQQAGQAAASAAGAAALVLGVASNRPSIRPSLLLDFASTKQLDPRITFTRASVGTYYDSSTAYAGGVNLFTYSQQFDNAAWAKYSVTVTADATPAPDGTTTADAVITTAATAIQFITGGSASGTCTFSVYAKANGYSYLQMYGSGNADYANFNLSNGTVSQSSGGSPSITSVGNGWYRCSITSANLDTCYLAPKIAGTEGRHASITGNGTSGVYLWGAQLEPYSIMSGYTPTTSVAINVPVFVPKLETAAANVARFDHAPTTGESLGLLVEEQRTNYLTYGSDLSNAVWAAGGSAASVSAGATIAPDGTLTGAKIIPTAGTTMGYIVRNISALLTNGITYTATIFAKAAGYPRLGFRCYDATAYLWHTTIDLTTGTVVTGSATVTSVGNGWWKITVTGTATNTGNDLTVEAHNASSVCQTAFTADGTSGIYVWGCQLEAGAFPTSYIPTASAQVTRAADSAAIASQNMAWFRKDEGTIYAEATSRMAYDTGAGPVSVVAGFGDAVNNRFEAIARIDTSSRVYRTYGYWRDADYENTSVYEGADNSYSPNTAIKAAVAMKAGDYAASFNGATVMATSAINRLINARLNIGSDWMGAALNGTIRRIAYFPARLSNVELQGLTA